MAHIYTIQNKKGLIPYSNEPSASQISNKAELCVEIYSIDEFMKVDLGDDDIEEAISLLSRSQGSSINTLPDCFIGSLSFPSKIDSAFHFVHFGFYLNPKRLIFIDSSEVSRDVLVSLKTLEKLPQISTLRILYEFIKYFIEDDPIYLSDTEKYLSDAEESILEQRTNISNQELLSHRRKLIKYDRFYQQLTDISSIIAKDEYLIFSKDDRRLFRLLGQQTERLLQRAQYLKEYSMQLRELHQMQVDAEQNRTIQWLTVITTLVVPLTLITSWYGMNFSHMPELEWEYGYAVVIVVCIILVIAQLLFFKKRKWL